MIGAVGLIYLSFGGLVFVVPFLFGLLPHGHAAVVDELARVAVGILGLLLYAMSRLMEAERNAAGLRA